MTSLDRAVYRHVKRSSTTKELIEAYISTKEERHFVETMTRSGQSQLNLMLWIKLFPCLGYFPGVDEIPFVIVTLFAKPSLPEELVPAYDNPRTFTVIKWYESMTRSFPMTKTLAGPLYARSCRLFARWRTRQISSMRPLTNWSSNAMKCQHLAPWIVW